MVALRKSYWAALAVALVVGAWFLSGQLGTEQAAVRPLSQQAAAGAPGQGGAEPARVRGRITRASSQLRQLRIRGKTEHKRMVTVRAEITGRLVARPVERGSQVAAGDVLCRLSNDDRDVSLADAQAGLELARLEHQGNLQLKTEGFQSELLAARTEARLAAAQAELTRSRLDLMRLEVRAPFAGVVEEVHLELGDYATPGSACVTLVDLDPMLLVGQASERDVPGLAPGMPARGALSGGEMVSGEVSFIGRVSDEDTRSYRFEVQVPNPQNKLRSGASVEILLPVQEVMAHRVSPSLFALDDDGVMGLRSVDGTGTVVFNPVEIIRDDADGVWVTGLPEVTTLITVGQELVVPGQLVEVEPDGPAGR